MASVPRLQPVAVGQRGAVDDVQVEEADAQVQLLADVQVLLIGFSDCPFFLVEISPPKKGLAWFLKKQSSFLDASPVPELCVPAKENSSNRSGQKRGDPLQEEEEEEEDTE